MNIFTNYIWLGVFCALCQVKEAVGRESNSDFYSKCGQLPVKKTVVGGHPIPQEIMRKGFPWLINIRTRAQPSNVICGGSIIGQNLVMTAAHCLFNGRMRKASDLWVFVNSHNISDTNSKEFRVAVKRIHVHSSYNSRQYSFDLAILETATNMGVDYPLCIPCLAELKTDQKSIMYPRQPDVEETCMIVGWGTTEDSHRSSLPMGAEVKIMSNKDCKQHWPNLNRAMLCTEQSAETGASCNVTDHRQFPVQATPQNLQGDSGGPLYCYDRNSDRFVLQGVVSWGAIGCQTKPSVFTNVAVLRRWIATKLKELGVPDMCSETDNIAPEPCSDDDESCRPSGNPPSCDATQFKFANDHYVVGTLTTKTHYLHETLTMAQCVDKCCEADDCQSALFYKESLECFLYTDKNCEPTTSVMAKEEEGVEYFAKECRA